MQLFMGVYHFHGKSGWNGTLVMVQDFPGVAFRQARVSRGWEKKQQIKMADASAVWEGGKRDRVEPGRVGAQPNGTGIFRSVSVGTGKEGYV